MNFLTFEMWSPYVVGVLIGLLNLGSMLVSKKPLGASTSFMKIGGIGFGLFNKEKVESNEYYQKNDVEQAQEEVEVDIAKHRNGPTRRIKLAFSRNINAFYNLVLEE
jgi:hypothetical protein